MDNNYNNDQRNTNSEPYGQENGYSDTPAQEQNNSYPAQNDVQNTYGQNDGNGYSGAENNSNSFGYNRQSYYNSSHNGSSDYYHSYFGSSSPYENAMYLMGISRVTPVNEIKRIYRSMVRKYHPDLVKAKGLPEEMIAVYEKKTKEINEAYDIICKNRNI